MTWNTRAILWSQISKDAPTSMMGLVASRDFPGGLPKRSKTDTESASPDTSGRLHFRLVCSRSGLVAQEAEWHEPGALELRFVASLSWQLVSSHRPMWGPFSVMCPVRAAGQFRAWRLSY